MNISVYRRVLMRIIVIGGTRFIGSYVVSQLIEQGHEVYVFHRGKTNVNIPENVNHIIGDRKNLMDFKTTFASLNPDVVLDMFPLTEDDAKTVVETLKGVTKRVVAISSADVYQTFGRLTGFEPGEPVPTPTSEDGPLRTKLYPYKSSLNPDDLLYDYDKILVEKVLMNEPSFDATILRLPMVYGPLDRQYRPYSYLKRMQDNRPFILIDEKLAKWKTCRGYVENVAHAIVLAITNKKASKQIYNVAEEVALPEILWINAIQKAYEKWNGEILTVSSGKLPVGLNADQHLDITSSKIREELGYTEIISPEEGLKRTLKWEIENPPEKINVAEYDYAKEDEIHAEITVEKG